MFKKIIRKLINWAQSDSNGCNPCDSIGIDTTAPRLKSAAPYNDIGDRNNGSNFTIFKASGGKVVRVHSYDERTDKQKSTLYIINDGEDIGHELNMILSMEALTQ